MTLMTRNILIPNTCYISNRENELLWTAKWMQEDFIAMTRMNMKMSHQLKTKFNVNNVGML